MLRLAPAIAAVVVLTVAIELVLEAADRGLVGSTRWRSLAYEYGAFWAGLVGDWRPNYRAQPVLMFVSYALLHGGFGHLAGNMLTLLGLGTIATDRVGQRGFLVLYVVSAVGGGAGFGLLATAQGVGAAPMVGASGALFGLAGAWQYWEARDRRALGLPLAPVWRTILGLAVLNAVLWVMLAGLLAWQTHLGGFVAGWATAAVLARWGKG